MSKGVLYIFCFCFSFTVTTYGQSGVVEAARRASEASIPTYNSPSETESVVSTKVSVVNEDERELVLSEKEINILIELPSNIDQYNTIYIVDAYLWNDTYNNSSYAKWTAGYLKKILISSSLEVIEPVSYDKQGWKKDPYFLRNIKNDKGIYLYLNQTKGRGDDVNSTLILRNSQKEILFKANFVNAGMNEILDVLTSL